MAEKTAYSDAIKALTDVLALYLPACGHDWKSPNATLLAAMQVLAVAYDSGMSITLSHAKWIDNHRHLLAGEK
jgi:hypothetical protein